MEIASRRTWQWALVVLRRRLLLMLLVMAVAVAIGLLFYFMAPRQYTASFEIDFQREELPQSMEQLIARMFPTFRESLEAEKKRICDKEVVEPALRRMGVITPEMSKTEAKAHTKAFQGFLRIDQVEASMVLRCTATHSDPATAYNLVYHLLEQYKADYVNLRTRYQQSRRQEWMKSLEDFRYEMQKDARALEFQRKFKELDQGIDALSRQLEETAEQLRDELEALQERQKELSARFTQDWPALAQVNLQLELFSMLLASGLDEDLEQKSSRLLYRATGRPCPDEVTRTKLDQWLELNQARLDLLDKKLELELEKVELEADLQAAGLELDELGTIEVQAIAMKRLIQTIQNKLPRVNMQLGNIVFDFQVINEPVLPRKPISPVLSRYLSLSLSSGLILALAAALFLERFDHTLHTIEDVRRHVDLEVLSVIPNLPSSRESGKPTARLVFQPVPVPHAGVEAYRLLRIALLAALAREPNQKLTLLVASSIPKEGKSTTASNLACAFAETGTRTALVGCNLRHPSLRDFFDVKPLPGVAELLRGRAELDACIRTTFLETLHVIPSGQAAEGSSLLINSPRFDSFLRELRRRCEIVIIDSPPALLLTDAQLLASRADATLMVCAQGKTPREALQRSLEMMRRSRAKLPGLALNQIKDSTGFRT